MNQGLDPTRSRGAQRVSLAHLAAAIGLVHAREKVAHTRAQSHQPVALPKLSQVAPLGTDLVLVDVDLARDDAELTKRILKAGTLMGIDVLDHLIVSEGDFLSMKERGLMSFTEMKGAHRLLLTLYHSKEMPYWQSTRRTKLGR